jgi:FAD/FMN-containing dehydrogenase
MPYLVVANELRQRVEGAVIGPSDPGYDEAREVWNRVFDRRPAIIVRPMTTGDVAASVTLARKHDLPIAIKSEGHHVAGHSACEGGLMLDMRSMGRIMVEPERRRAVVAAGLTWAHFDQVTQAFALACTGPIVSMTGLAGFTLGGGFGWLHRKIGLACDNLLAAEIVAANGEVIRASETENADLLWGLRGAGWNFGVVTTMELGLHAVGPTVVAGLIYWPLDRLSELIDRHRALIAELPAELTTWFFLQLAPPHPAIPKDWVGRPVVALALCHCGATEDGRAWVKRFTDLAPPIASTVDEIEYRLWQRTLDARWGNGFFNDWRGHYFDDLSPEAICILTRHVERLTSPWTDIKIPHLEGAVAKVADTATAYGNRRARFGLVIQARWERAEDSAGHIAWAKQLRDALAPHATGGAYANFLAIDEADRVSAAHGLENMPRLRSLKVKYDPGNVFRHNPGGASLASRC